MIEATAPARFDFRITAEGTPQYWAEQVLARLRPAFDPQKPTALFVGRYQPFHLGHRRLIEEGLHRMGLHRCAGHTSHRREKPTAVLRGEAAHRGGLVGLRRPLRGFAGAPYYQG